MPGPTSPNADKTELKKMNEEISTLENTFRTKLLAATKEAAYATTDKSKLAGLSEAQLAAAAGRLPGRESRKAGCCPCKTRPSSPTWPT